MEKSKLKINRSVGRPQLFKTPKAMQKVIDNYFKSCKPTFEKDEKGKILTTSKGLPVSKLNPPTITGLALALGFNSRGTIYDYEKKNDEFSDTIKRARLRCENWIEVNLLSNNVAPAAGIFALKNYGWRDNFGLTDGEGGKLNGIMLYLNSLTDEEINKIKDE